MVIKKVLSCLLLTASCVASMAPVALGDIAFSSGASNDTDLFVVDNSGGNIRQLTDTSGVDNLRPTWSPDGKKIAFTSNRSGSSDIWLLDVSTLAVTQLTSGAENDASQSWSPDDKKLVFSRNFELYTINSDGSGLTQLTHNSLIDLTPSWSPNGDKIAYTSLIDGNFQIFTIDANGNNSTQLTQVGSSSVPNWTPDGKRIVFNSTRETIYQQIFVMNADGSGQARLFNNTTNDLMPAVSPDNLNLAFASGQSSSSAELFTVAFNGADRKQLTSGRAAITYPEYRPEFKVLFGNPATLATTQTVKLKLKAFRKLLRQGLVADIYGGGAVKASLVHKAGKRCYKPGTRRKKTSCTKVFSRGVSFNRTGILTPFGYEPLSRAKIKKVGRGTYKLKLSVTPVYSDAASTFRYTFKVR